ncbi:MAG: VOC family protein [Proteobacteria bacterium]|nr:VOC family protein [Pseudomonadota bacterium]
MIHELYPYLRVRDTAAAIAFYAQAFGAVERFRLVEPSGRIGHAELQIGPAVLMLSDAFPEHGLEAPASAAPAACLIHLHVDDADAVIARAVAAGASIDMPAADMFYGERSGRIRDPYGHVWLIGHSIEDVTPEEMQRRYTALLQE